MDRSAPANPHGGDILEGFVHLRPKAPSHILLPETLALYEAWRNWDEGISVLYADGHGEFLRDEARCRRELAAEGLPSTTPGRQGGKTLVLALDEWRA